MAPEDWTQWLALAMVVHNNQINVTTGLSPNQIILGYDIPINPELTDSVSNETAEERIQIMNERQAQAITALNEVARKSGTPPAQYKPGDQVWLEGKNLKLPYQSTKLAPKRYGPFRVIKEVSPVAYQLALLPAWRIHNVFHASLLSSYSETPTHRPNFSQPPPDMIDDQEEYEVEQVRNHWYYGCKRTLQYLIK
jgi:hypothetical protein